MPRDTGSLSPPLSRVEEAVSFLWATKLLGFAANTRFLMIWMILPVILAVMISFPEFDSFSQIF